MNIGVLGTGMVGDAIASKLVSLGHNVMMGSRDAQNPKAVAWAQRAGQHAQAGSFADAARFGAVVVNCTHGANSIDALRGAGASNLSGKVVVDVANVLAQAGAGPESLGEQIQQAFPDVKVVKTLNTMNNEVMVDPSKVSGPHAVFMSGNDADAKETVRRLLESFGWKDIIDLGDITTARAAEAYLPLWMALSKRLGTFRFNIRIVR